MNVADYLRYRLAQQPSMDPTEVRNALFSELCALATDEFGEETLRNWGVWHWVEPHTKAAA